MATIKEQTEKTERLKTSLNNKVDSIGNIINTKVKEKPTTLTQVEDVLNRKMVGVGDIFTEVQIQNIGREVCNPDKISGFSTNLNDMTSDDEFIYSVGDLYTVNKIRKSDMTIVGKCTNAPRYVVALTSDAEFIYASANNIGFVYKIRKSDMVLIGEVNLGASPNGIYALHSDGEFVYAGKYSGVVSKIRVSDMTQITGRETGIEYGVYAITSDNEFVYVGGYGGRVVKLRKSDMTIVDYWHDKNSSMNSITIDNEFVYVGGTYPEIYKLRKSDMTLISFISPHTNSVTALNSDDDFIYSGGGEKAVAIIRKSNMQVLTTISSFPDVVQCIAFDKDLIYSCCTNTIYKHYKFEKYKIISI